MKTTRIILRGDICDKLNGYCKLVNKNKEQVVTMALQQYLVITEIAPNIIEVPEVIPEVIPEVKIIEDNVPVKTKIIC
jgi:hypothetical protein